MSKADTNHTTPAPEPDFSLFDITTMAWAFHEAQQIFEKAQGESDTTRAASFLLDEAAAMMEHRANYWADLAITTEPTSREESMFRASFCLWWASILSAQRKDAQDGVFDFYGKEGSKWPPCTTSAPPARSRRSPGVATSVSSAPTRS